MTPRAEATYLDDYAARKATLPGQDLSWVAELREAGIARFEVLGFATPKVEEWKYTNLKPFLVRTAYPAAGAATADIASPLLSRHVLADAHCLVFVNGNHRPDLSKIGELPAGVRLGGLAELLNDAPELIEPHLGRIARLDGQAPLALNAAMMNDGGVVLVDNRIDRPIHFLFIATVQDPPPAAHPRNLIVAAPGSSATVVESYVSGHGERYWTNAATEVDCAPGSRLAHLKLQTESAEAFHLAATSVDVAPGARYDSFVLSHGALLSRHEIVASLSGPDGDCRLNGVFLGRDRQHLDTTTVIDHRQPGSRSDQFYKGVLDDSARGVFQGKIIVQPDAQGTDAHQLNKNLLLTPGAQMDSKPELRIFADDVKCSHGAAIGDLDVDALFYLRARGVDEESARRTLIAAFIEELVDGIAHPVVRSRFRDSAAAFLAGDTPSVER